MVKIYLYNFETQSLGKLNIVLAVSEYTRFLHSVASIRLVKTRTKIALTVIKTQ